MRFVDITAQLASRGHAVLPVTRANSRVAKELTAKGLQVQTMRKVYDYFDPMVIASLAKLFKQNGVQTVHLHRTQDLGVAVAAATLAGVSTRVFTLRMEPGRPKRDLYHRWAYGKLTNLLTLTDRMTRLVIENIAIDPRKIMKVSNGIDLKLLRKQAERREEIRARWGISQDAFIVGLLGRVDPLKGQRLLLEAVYLLKKTIPNVFAIIAGEETFSEHGEINYLKTLINDKGIQDRVLLTGFIDHPGKILPAFDLSIVASRKETFGQVVIESLALGIPTIATNAGGVPEIISHLHDGMLVEPENVEELVKAIQLLYVNPKQREQFASEGFQTIQEKFSMERHLLVMEQVLRLKPSGNDYCTLDDLYNIDN